MITNWEWSQINRANDYNYVGGRFVKDNWVAIRARISDEPFVSQLDEEEFSLTAYNGGIAETVSANYVDGLTFNTTTAWNDTSWVWINSGIIQYGFPVYRPPFDATNKPDPSKINVVQVLVSSGMYYWIVSEVEQDNLYAGNLAINANWIGATTPGFILHGKPFTVTNGTFTGVAIASIGSTQQSWLCVADNQRYDERGVGWYTQEQVWRIQGAWRPH